MYLRNMTTFSNESIHEFTTSFSTTLIVFLGAFFLIANHYYRWVDSVAEMVERFIGLPPIVEPMDTKILSHEPMWSAVCSKSGHIYVPV